MAASNRKGWIDLSRGFLMFLVFVYHSEVIYGIGHTWSWTFESFFLTGFFFLSGYLFTSNLSNVTLRAKVKQVVRAILIPYFVFTLGLLLPKMFFLGVNVKASLLDIFLLRASWFVIVIGMLQVLYALVASKWRTQKAIVISTIVFGLVGYAFVWSYGHQLAWLMSRPILYSNELPARLPACINLMFLACPWYGAGIVLRLSENKIKGSLHYGGGIGLLLLYVITIWLDYRYIGSSIVFVICAANNFLLILLYSAIAIASIIVLSKKIDFVKPINYIGKNSIIFYFLNALMLNVVNVMITKLNIGYLADNKGYMNVILVAIFAVALTFPVVWFINKYLPLIVGNKNSYNTLSQRLGWNIEW